MSAHLRQAAIKAGVEVSDEDGFGLHNLRHSLSNWMANKEKVEPETAQGILRYSCVQTTLKLYTQEDASKTRAAGSPPSGTREGKTATV